MMLIKKGAFVAILFVFIFGWAYAGMDHGEMEHGRMEHDGIDRKTMQHEGMNHAAMMAGEDHSAHMAMMQQQNDFKERQAKYQVPDVELLDQHGNRVKLRQLLQEKEPYALNFIFTTCTTICPVLTASFSHMQHELGAAADKLNLISISIDPEYDTPKVLREYSKKARADKNWTFLTGDYKTIIAVEKAFDNYTSDKMNHRPAYMFKLAGNDSWHRVDGLASGTDLANIYQTLDLF